MNRCGSVVIDNPEIMLIDQIGADNLLSTYCGVFTLIGQKTFDYSNLNEKIIARLDDQVFVIFL